ncbi:hypothetical protein F5887DRAFT_947217 [Amanita rubescens]|nr:hypothetical protein F5887DRAFT_947217 [Amanita rubescens]
MANVSSQERSPLLPIELPPKPEFLPDHSIYPSPPRAPPTDDDVAAAIRYLRNVEHYNLRRQMSNTDLANASKYHTQVTAAHAGIPYTTGGSGTRAGPGGSANDFQRITVQLGQIVHDLERSSQSYQQLHRKYEQLHESYEQLDRNYQQLNEEYRQTNESSQVLLVQNHRDLNAGYVHLNDSERWLNENYRELNQNHHGFNVNQQHLNENHQRLDIDYQTLNQQR